MASRILPRGARLDLPGVQWALSPDAASAPGFAPMATAPERPRELTAAQTELQSQVARQVESRLQAEREAAARLGEAAGRQKALAELEETFTRLAHSIEHVAGMKPRLRQEAERDVVALSLAIARRILHRQLQMDEDALLGLVKGALESAGLREVTEVRVHPHFAARLQASLARIGTPQEVRVQSDASLEPGALLVETSRGSLDASIDTQLEEIGRGLADELSAPGTAR